MTKILIADDHAIVRQALRTLLEAEDGLTVIGEACSGIEAIHHCEKLKPGILVLDIMLDDINGIEVIRRIRESCPEVSIIVLSMHDDKYHVTEAMRLGAKAYVAKQTVSEEFIKAVREVASGHHYLGFSPLESLVEGSTELTQTDLYESLTTREREILHLTVNGFNCRQIGARLHISARTVETYLGSAMHKLDLKNREELIRYALDYGIVALEESIS